ncbi:MAG: hypothetical protein ACRENI_12375 [Gemmatimonadaceae bacterium]
MAFFRGRQPEFSLEKRFRSGIDGFTFVKEGDHYAAHVVANAERVVDLFHALSEHLPPAVDVALADERTGQRWKGEAVALPDVREGVARLKVLLAGHGGVEFAIYTSEDQLTLNAAIELFIYARTDQWLYILQGKGLEERRALRTKSWKLSRRKFPPAPALVQAVVETATRLGLALE